LPVAAGLNEVGTAQYCVICASPWAEAASEADMTHIITAARALKRKRAVEVRLYIGFIVVFLKAIQS
jgi:hypothetical protein